MTPSRQLGGWGGGKGQGLSTLDPKEEERGRRYRFVTGKDWMGPGSESVGLPDIGEGGQGVDESPVPE